MRHNSDEARVSVIDLEIVFEDDYLIGVNKPAGLLVHPSWITAADEPTLMGLLKAYTGAPKLHTIHRLDRATSGIILVGKTLEATQHIQAQFLQRSINKTYLAAVRGWTQDAEVIDYALVPKRDKFAEPMAQENPEAKEAVSTYRTLGRVELDIPIGRYPKARYSLVEVKPSTGRKHQIRRHMKHILHPIVGDTKYGEGRHNRLFREHFELHRLLLMATELEFIHPKGETRLKLSASVDRQVDELFTQFGWQGLYPVAKT